MGEASLTTSLGAGTIWGSTGLRHSLAGEGSLAAHAGTSRSGVQKALLTGRATPTRGLTSPVGTRVHGIRAVKEEPLLEITKIPDKTEPQVSCQGRSLGSSRAIQTKNVLAQRKPVL